MNAIAESLSRLNHRAKVRLVVMGVVAILLLAGYFRMNSSRFNSLAWQLPGDLKVGGPRDRMADDLVNNRLRPGMSKRQILSLLGTEYDEYDGDWYYEVASGRVRGGGSHWGMTVNKELMLRFNPDDTLASARLIGTRPVEMEEPRPDLVPDIVAGPRDY